LSPDRLRLKPKPPDPSGRQQNSAIARALADLLLVDGDPISNIKLIEEPEKNLVIIMKDGKIYKNTLPK
jgi:hypothetical protein